MNIYLKRAGLSLFVCLFTSVSFFVFPCLSYDPDAPSSSIVGKIHSSFDTEDNDDFPHPLPHAYASLGGGGGAIGHGYASH